MGNGYGSYRTTREADMRHYDGADPDLRALLRERVGNWAVKPVVDEARALFAELGGRRAVLDLMRADFERSEKMDAFRTWGPTHPQADAGGRRLRPGKTAVWAKGKHHGG